MKKIIETLKSLNKSIYVGERLKANLKALTAISIVSAVLGAILIFVNILTGPNLLLIASIATLVAGVGCAICAGVLKKREIAIIIPTVFCMIAFTVYAFTGAGKGTAIFWTLLMPIGVSYFVSVKYGLILSVYYSILFSVLFYSPLKENLTGYYTDDFMVRFPLVFIFVSIFTGISMVQYHKAALFEIEHTNSLSEEVRKQTKIATDRAIRLEHITEEIVQTLALVIDAKDKYTNGHSFRVSTYSVALAKELGFSEEDLAELRWEALLHDIGKIGIPDNILNKPGKLTPEEFDVIKSHTTIGGNILAKTSELPGASDTAKYHHERYDGKGYPSGLSGKNIPVQARIVSIADAYDAMHSDRIYRKGLEKDVIRREFERCRGTQFDPDFLDVFIKLFEDGKLDELDHSTDILAVKEKV